jgi:hypothetical protein
MENFGKNEEVGEEEDDREKAGKSKNRSKTSIALSLLV